MSTGQPGATKSTKTLIYLIFVFMIAGIGLYFVGTAVYGGREFTISLLGSCIGVFFGAAIGTTLLLVDQVYLALPLAKWNDGLIKETIEFHEKYMVERRGGKP